jgi:hypothetical protein
VLLTFTFPDGFRLSFKLEQTGSVIMQTFSGMALDSHHTRSQEDPPGVPSNSEPSAVQRLLNTFAFLNVLHFIVLVVLFFLDRRRKRALNSISQNDGPLGGILTDDFNEDQSGLPKSAEYADHTMATEGSTYLPTSVSWATPHEQSPLLSDREESYTGGLAEPARPHQLPQLKQYDVRRGRVFAGLSAALVVFAWVLFLATAWSRLRSKSQREGTPAGFVGHR